jgi:outer membrane receptor protein involved in Fe transport
MIVIWARERHRNKHTRQPSEVVHSHLLLHLPSQYREAARQDVEELVAVVAQQILDDRAIELTFPASGTPAVWDTFSVPDKWRSNRGEGVIDGKRCGTTQNIGPAARERRYARQQDQVCEAVA